MFENIYEAIDFMENFDVYTDSCLRSIGELNKPYSDGSERKAVILVECEYSSAELIVRFKENDEIETIEIPFQYAFSFVIDCENMYISDKTVELDSLFDIFVEDL